VVEAFHNDNQGSYYEPFCCGTPDHMSDPFFMQHPNLRELMPIY